MDLKQNLNNNIATAVVDEVNPLIRQKFCKSPPKTAHDRSIIPFDAQRCRKGMKIVRSYDYILVRIAS